MTRDPVSIAHVQLLANDLGAARQSLDAAISEAVLQRLPHQLQRAVRVAGEALPDIRVMATQAVQRLRDQMSA